MSFEVLAVIQTRPFLSESKNLFRETDCKLNIGGAPGKRNVSSAESSKRSQLEYLHSFPFHLYCAQIYPWYFPQIMSSLREG